MSNKLKQNIIARALEKKSKIILPELNDKRVIEAVIELKNIGFNIISPLDIDRDKYFSYAKRSKYFSNTVFFLFGDHGTSDPWAKHMPQSDYELLLRSYHVPLIVYGPGIIKGGIMRNDIAMLPDLIPTAAGFAGISYHNQTLGRDLMSIANNQEGLALTVGKKHARPTIGLFGSHYYLTMQSQNLKGCLPPLGTSSNQILNRSRMLQDEVSLSPQIRCPLRLPQRSYFLRILL